MKITLHFLEKPEINGIFNAGTGSPRNFKDLAAAVFSALGTEPQIKYIDMPEGLEKRYQYYTSLNQRSCERQDLRTTS